LHPVARVFANAFLKTTIRNNVFVIDFIVHYLHVSAPIDGHLQVICRLNIYFMYILPEDGHRSGPKHVVSSAQ
jgi:hypothetical protein